MSSCVRSVSLCFAYLLCVDECAAVSSLQTARPMQAFRLDTLAPQTGCVVMETAISSNIVHLSSRSAAGTAFNPVVIVKNPFLRDPR
jgi:hypothetical protein